MLGEIGIPVLLLIFGYVFYIFTKPQEKVNEKPIFLDYIKSGTRGIPGMTTQKSKKRKRIIH